MADAVPNKETEFLPSQVPSGREVLGQIDSQIYKQLLLFLAIAAVLATGFYIYLRVGQEANVKSPAEKNNKVANTPQKSKLNQTQQTSTADQQRKNDVSMINSALKTYYLENKVVPDTLDVLVPNLLVKTPVDPQTKTNYTYQTDSDKTSWVVAAILSDGTVFDARGP
ncbi:MAG: hypothetical protein Q8O75_02610 [bacterium]|nr:hypothetical protein [bacterium]